jgi:hypothetical protein
MIEAEQLTKRYGDKTAVEDLSFTVRPGIVTGFLGVPARIRSWRREDRLVAGGPRWRDPDSNRGHHDLQSLSRIRLTAVESLPSHGERSNNSATCADARPRFGHHPG